MPGVALDNLDIGQTTLTRELLRTGNIVRVEIEADNTPDRTNSGRKQFEDAAWPTAQIDRSPTLPNAGVIEQGRALRAEFLGLSAEPITLGPIGAEGIDRRLAWSPPLVARCAGHAAKSYAGLFIWTHGTSRYLDTLSGDKSLPLRQFGPG